MCCTSRIGMTIEKCTKKYYRLVSLFIQTGDYFLKIHPVTCMSYKPEVTRRQSVVFGDNGSTVTR